jgi:hypothetical protein
MQIFEITAKKQINEINLGATVGAIGSAIGDKILSTTAQAAGVNAQDYADAIAGGTPKTGYAGQQAAAKEAQPVIKQQAQAAQTAWKNQAAQMANAARGSFTQIDPMQKHDALKKFVNDHLMSGRVADYTQLPSLVDPKSFGGKGQQLAKQTVANIEALINNILAMDPAVTPTRQQTQAWEQLANMTYNATNQATFQAGYGGQAGTKTSAKVADPRASALMSAMGLGMDDVAKLNAVMKQKGGFKGQATGDPYIDGLLKAARLI